ncbi:hypothetical protein G3480_16225 [Thiorhodococcus mannitoliphagus]|uniref:Uncharacterized protein n=1 Tax=Thiorhodococcus mannitoliphagus TaxID=329406 RepID=A0A6P1DU39_9GAMM|nr:hypothetical protein [Thiorhodococcus mannitoliphagus]NEX21837.1 hypothetical protein [Thiorhodococcus mannitoliphagus]
MSSYFAAQLFGLLVFSIGAASCSSRVSVKDSEIARVDKPIQTGPQEETREQCEDRYIKRRLEECDTAGIDVGCFGSGLQSEIKEECGYVDDREQLSEKQKSVLEEHCSKDPSLSSMSKADSSWFANYPPNSVLIEKAQAECKQIFDNTRTSKPLPPEVDQEQVISSATSAKVEPAHVCRANILSFVPKGCNWTVACSENHAMNERACIIGTAGPSWDGKYTFANDYGPKFKYRNRSSGGFYVVAFVNYHPGRKGAMRIGSESPIYVDDQINGLITKSTSDIRNSLISAETQGESLYWSYSLWPSGTSEDSVSLLGFKDADSYVTRWLER